MIGLVLFASAMLSAVSPNFETTQMYSTSGAEIKKLPTVEAEVIDYANKNTTFDVIGVIDDYYIINAESGVAYINADDLSAEELPEYTDEELEIVTRIIVGEAHTCDDMEQRYVASVLLNRVASPEFPDTIEKCAFQRGQYKCTWDGNYYRTPTERNWENARYVLEHGSVLPENVVFQSKSKLGKVYIKTKHHTYCY